jgi:hypothetical protein
MWPGSFGLKPFLHGTGSRSQGSSTVQKADRKRGVRRQARASRIWSSRKINTRPGELLFVYLSRCQSPELVTVHPKGLEIRKPASGETEKTYLIPFAKIVGISLARPKHLELVSNQSPTGMISKNINKKWRERRGSNP